MDIQKLLKKIRNRKKDAPPVCSAVIVAAGSSARMGTDKILAELGGMPVLVRTLQPFQNSPLVEEIVVVTCADKLDVVAELRQTYQLTKLTKIICGGATRTESVLAGVSEVKSGAKLIAIHDGARPLVTVDLIERTVYAARDFLAAAPAIPSTDTLKYVDEENNVIAGVDRARTLRVQTPQVFSAELIKGALTQAVTKGLALTDDCSAIERMGVKPRLVPGEEDNLKLTTPRDMVLAATILKDRGDYVADRSRV